MIPTTGLRLVFLKTRTGASREGAFSQAKAFLRTWNSHHQNVAGSPSTRGVRDPVLGGREEEG